MDHLKFQQLKYCVYFILLFVLYDALLRFWKLLNNGSKIPSLTSNMSYCLAPVEHKARRLFGTPSLKPSSSDIETFEWIKCVVI